MTLEGDARDCHRRPPTGKVEIATAEPTNTQRDLSLVYPPGVAAPCHDIAEDEGVTYKYTAKDNLVDITPNGSAMLGLSNIGTQASKPVIESKSMLFKRFAGIDMFDVEFDHDGPQAFVESVATTEPASDSINLEDTRVPECSEIEESLHERMDIPAFHDGQHGTAIISRAALLSAADIANKEPSSLNVTFSRADAAATTTARFYVSLGIPHENITLYDIDGVLSESRAEIGKLDEYTEPFARGVDDGDPEDAMEGANVLVDLSIGGIVSQEAVRSTANDPIIFAMANPEPGIAYEGTKGARDDTIIMTTGRSGYPNQMNNVLRFPFIFRSTPDVRATEINEETKRAAVEALADLARQDVPDAVVKAYSSDPLQFGPGYPIPKPLDQRVLHEVAPAVAEAAMGSGTTRRKRDLDDYHEELEARLGRSREIMCVVLNKVTSNPKYVVLAEDKDRKMIRVASQLVEEGIAKPILIGRTKGILRIAEGFNLDFDSTIADPESGEWNHYVDHLYKHRQREGLTRTEAAELVQGDSNYFASVMVKVGNVDAMLTGLTHHYPSALRPPLQIVGTANDTDYATGVYMLTFRNRVIFCADATIDLDPDENVLAKVTKHTAELARRFSVELRAVLLSYSDFGGVTNEGAHKPRNAVEQLHAGPDVDFPVDGEMQADTALVEEMLTDTYGFVELDDPVNVLVFPNLGAGDASYELLQRFSGAEAVGPMLVGMDKPIHILQRGDEVRDIVNLTGVAMVDTQSEQRPRAE